MIRFRDIDTAGILDNPPSYDAFKEIKAINPLSSEQLHSFWDKLFGCEDEPHPLDGVNVHAETFGRSQDEFHFDFKIEGKLQESIEPFSPEKWKELSESERIKAINEFSVQLADQLDIERKPKIKYFQDDDDICGTYYTDTNVLTVNKNLLHYPEELVDTIAHEIRHAYQYQRALKAETKQDYLYRFNFEHYVSPIKMDDGSYVLFTEYQDQLVEAEARAFADLFRKEVSE